MATLIVLGPPLLLITSSPWPAPGAIVSPPPLREAGDPAYRRSPSLDSAEDTFRSRSEQRLWSARDLSPLWISPPRLS